MSSVEFNKNSMREMRENVYMLMCIPFPEIAMGYLIYYHSSSSLPHGFIYSSFSFSLPLEISNSDVLFSKSCPVPSVFLFRPFFFFENPLTSRWYRHEGGGVGLALFPAFTLK